ncbi:Major facilitator superfamily domain general substrate transporter [Penicillium paradoxum]|uniref:Major facilitator superfamily domain general substrate transporter n=1 Tax=Penicillium paradoxum TaxID=176176 RepID=UPI00254715DB|nr:Major facilitator superfamily domain general substrate transporter [Penicillium paradoxum]KAJ5787776.1 Major facilitator superfamily domain general substrate transporter [Penicillium paradoxum]
MGFFNAFKPKSPKEADGSEVQIEPKTEDKLDKNDISYNNTYSQSGGQISTLSSIEETSFVDEPPGSPTSKNDTEKEPASRDSPTPVQNEEVNEDSEDVVPSAALDTEPTQEEKEEDSDTETPKDEEEYPNAWRLTLITIALCLCVFCVALDNTIIATAIPKITDQFGSINDVGWYGSSYLLTTCAVSLMFGKLYTFYSIKWIYLIALFIFEIGSLICAVTPTSVGLICGRAIAGLGAAGLFSGSILIISKSVPLVQRPMYTGLVGSMFGIANVAGPLMGGAFTDHLTWRWCFYINLPIGAVTFLFVLFFYQNPKAILKKNSIMEQIKELDLIGSFFFLPAIISLLLALQWGGTKYEWSNGRIIGLFVVFGVLGLVFIGVQIWAGDRATVPPRLIKNRSVWGSAWYALALGGAFFVMTYYLPIWFQSIKGATALKSGIMNLPTIIAVVVVSILAGGLVTACGYYTPFMIASSIIMTIGAGLLTTLETDSNHSKWIGYQALFGIGLGLGMQQPMIVIQTALKVEDIPSGTAIVMFAQTLGGAIFVSVGQNVFQNQLFQNFAKYAPEVDAVKLISDGATKLRTAVSGDSLQHVLVAYNAAIVQTFYVAVAMGALSLVGPIFVEWISVKGKKVEITPV